MSCKRNEIAVEWLESKDKGLINRVNNVKHIESELKNTKEGSEVIVKLGTRRYCAKITSLNGSLDQDIEKEEMKKKAAENKQRS